MRLAGAMQLRSPILLIEHACRGLLAASWLSQHVSGCAGRAALASDVLAVCRAEQQYAEGSQKDGVQVRLQ